MPDPIEELENFTSPGLTMTPMPASEVRRRGTRLRRRNTALATVAGVAAVAVIATPLAVAAGGHNSSNPQPVPPATQQATEWVTTIPADFPLTDGMPEKNGHDGSPVTARDTYEPQAVDVCEGGEGWAPDGAKDVSQATYTGESEGGQDRTLALYGDDGAATATLTSLTAQVEACAASSAGKNRSAEVVASDADSLSYVDHMSDAGDMFVHTVQRVGNALLLDSTYAMGGGDPQVVQQTVNLLTDKSAGVLDAMCAFAPDPC
jgi:hypothetical protein